jgi:tetratricopeptide (TPR) repeat protein
VKSRVERSQVLIDLLGDSPHVVPTLWALASYHQLRAQHPQARALAERLVSMEGLKQDVSHQAMVLPLLAECFRMEGWFVQARDCAARALALQDAPTPRVLSMFAMEPRTHAMACMGFVQWYLGFPDEGLRMMESALARARELNHVSTLAIASIMTLVIYHLREDLPRFDALSVQLLELTSRQRLVSQGAYAQFLRSWATRDLEGMQRGLALLDEQGSALAWPFYASMAAEVEAALGHHELALQRLDEGLRRARAASEGESVVDLLYRQGNILVAKDPESAEGEARLREALALARERSAKMIELRAAIPLCGLLLRRGQRAEARELLVPLYGWFTEGFDTQDLKRARAMIEEIGP